MKLTAEYIAGFIDGEGCIYADRRGARLIITNTDFSILEAIHLYFGKKSRISKARIDKWHRRPVWHLMYWNRHCEAILKELLPYLIIKRTQAELAIEFMSTYRKHGAPKGSWGETKLPEEVLTKRDELSMKIKELKRAS